MATRTAAAKNDTTRPADHVTAIDKGFSTDQDLLAISGRPCHAPQETTVINEGSSFADFIFIAEDDTATTTIPIPGNHLYIVNTPIKTLKATTSDDITVVCYWWAGSGVDYNK